jgi:acyl carrier protein
MAANVEQRVKKVVSKVLRADTGKINVEQSFADDLGADSTQSIELVAMFEDEFKIEMDEDRALACDTVGKAVEYITEVCKRQHK